MILTSILRYSVRPFFARPSARAAGYGRRIRSDPSKRAFCSFYHDYGCTFRDFLEIMGTLRFRWAQAPTVNYPGLTLQAPLGSLKGEKQIS
jgi:hypothetical protein